MRGMPLALVNVLRNPELEALLDNYVQKQEEDKKMKDGQEEAQMPQTLSLLMAVDPKDEKKEEDPKDETSSQDTIPEDLDELELAIQEQERRVDAAQAAYRAYREQVANGTNPAALAIKKAKRYGLPEPLHPFTRLWPLTPPPRSWPWPGEDEACKHGP